MYKKDIKLGDILYWNTTGAYNSDISLDEMKIETLDCLIRIIKARNKYKEKVLEQREQIKKKQEALKMLGL